MHLAAGVAKALYRGLTDAAATAGNYDRFARQATHRVQFYCRSRSLCDSEKVTPRRR